MAANLVGNSLSVSLYFFSFVCGLAHVLSYHFLSRFVGYYSQALGQEVVAAVARLYRYEVVLVAQPLNVVFQKYFHCLV